MEFNFTPETTIQEIKAVLVAEGYDVRAIRPEKVKEYYDKGGLYWSNLEIMLVGETGVPVATYKPLRDLAEARHSVPNRPQGWERESI